MQVLVVSSEITQRRLPANKKNASCLTLPDQQLEGLGATNKCQFPIFLRHLKNKASQSHTLGITCRVYL